MEKVKCPRYVQMCRFDICSSTTASGTNQKFRIVEVRIELSAHKILSRKFSCISSLSL